LLVQIHPIHLRVLSPESYYATAVHFETALNTTFAQGQIGKVGQEVNFKEALHSAPRSDRVLFALAIIALGVETSAFENYGFFGGAALATRFFLFRGCPAGIPWLAYAFGTICVACATGLLFEHARQVASAIFGGLLILCTLILGLPKYARQPASMSLRTAVCEPLRSLLWPGFCRVVGWCPVGERAQVAIC
jgi:hypothetical protein